MMEHSFGEKNNNKIVDLFVYSVIKATSAERENMAFKATLGQVTTADI